MTESGESVPFMLWANSNPTIRYVFYVDPLAHDEAMRTIYRWARFTDPNLANQFWELVPGNRYKMDAPATNRATSENEGGRTNG